MLSAPTIRPWPMQSPRLLLSLMLCVIFWPQKTVFATGAGADVPDVGGRDAVERIARVRRARVVDVAVDVVDVSGEVDRADLEDVLGQDARAG